MSPRQPVFRNIIRRGLRTAFDPDPTPAQKKKAFNFFLGRCAYCREELPSSGWDMDHLVSESRGGTNHISNRVPACKKCNSEERREKGYNDFSPSRSTGETKDARIERIEGWRKENGSAPLFAPEVKALWEEYETAVIELYNRAVRDLKAARKASDNRDF